VIADLQIRTKAGSGDKRDRNVKASSRHKKCSAVEATESVDARGAIPGTQVWLSSLVRPISCKLSQVKRDLDVAVAIADSSIGR